MTDEPDSLTLRFLRRIDAKIDGVIEMQHEHGHRLNRIESGLAAIRRDQAGDAETVAHMEARLDRLREDIDRIKRRLDLNEA